MRMGKEASMEGKKHFVLVHGACHGAWCWFKVTPLLKAAGHRVTTVDLVGSGINMKPITEILTHHEYVEPLLEILKSIPSNEKVILVGHSFGGLNLALAMELFPHKISVAVYLTAFMPDTQHQPSYVLETYEQRTPKDGWLDTQFTPYGTDKKPATSMLFGHKFLAHKLYQLNSPQDLELAKTLVRPGSLFVEDLSKAKKFTNEGYGSVKRVYIICTEDHGIPEEFQRWMIENSNVSEVMEIKDADHMVMLLKPQEVCDHLLAIAQGL